MWLIAAIVATVTYLARRLRRDKTKRVAPPPRPEILRGRPRDRSVQPITTLDSAVRDKKVNDSCR